MYGCKQYLWIWSNWDHAEVKDQPRVPTTTFCMLYVTIFSLFNWHLHTRLTVRAISLTTLAFIADNICTNEHWSKLDPAQQKDILLGVKDVLDMPGNLFTVPEGIGMIVCPFA